MQTPEAGQTSNGDSNGVRPSYAELLVLATKLNLNLDIWDMRNPDHADWVINLMTPPEGLEEHLKLHGKGRREYDDFS